MADIAFKSLYAVRGTVDTTGTLFVPDPISTTVAVQCSDTEEDKLIVVSAAGAPTSGYALINDSELVAYHKRAGNQCLELSRNVNGAGIATHVVGESVQLFDFYYAAMRAMRDAMIEMQTRMIAGGL